MLLKISVGRKLDKRCNSCYYFVHLLNSCGGKSKHLLKDNIEDKYTQLLYDTVMIMANASLRVLPVRSVMISQTSDAQCEGGWICSSSSHI